MSVLEFLGVFFILFVVLFIFLYFVSSKPKLRKIYVGEKETKKKKKKKESKKPEVRELNYLVYKFKLDEKKLNWKSLALWISIINSFIMSLVVVIIELVAVYFILKLMIAFVLLFALIYSLYEIYGRILKKKQEKED